MTSFDVQIVPENSDFGKGFVTPKKRNNYPSVTQNMNIHPSCHPRASPHHNYQNIVCGIPPPWRETRGSPMHAGLNIGVCVQSQCLAFSKGKSKIVFEQI
jgi:hypothetical protein